MVVWVVGAEAGSTAALVAAVRRFHPDVDVDVDIGVGVVWAGDPQLRGAPPAGARWVDLGLDEPSGVGWNRLLVALSPAAYALARAGRAVARHLAAGGPGLVVLRAGAVVVDGPLDGAVPASGVASIERSPTPPPADGLAPSAGDLGTFGRFGVAALAFAPDAGAAAAALAGVMVQVPPDEEAGAVAAAAIELSGCVVTPIEGAFVLGWHHPPAGSVPAGSAPRLVDVEQLDREKPWHLSFGGGPARIRLSEQQEVVALLDRTRAQWAGTTSLQLPGGFAVDRAIRNLAFGAIEAWRRGEGELPPEPFGAAGAAFVEWLETPWPPWGADIGRYWSELRRLRPELIAAFGQPEGADHGAFVAWAEHSWQAGHWSPMLRTGARGMRPAWHDGGREPGGVNLIGYLGFDKSLGDVARRIHRSLAAAGVPTAALHYHRSGSPTSAETPELTDRLQYDTNLVVVNADQFHLVDADYGPVLLAGRYTIAYWFWELAYVPPAMVHAIGLVDEVWVATDFTAAALRAVTHKPVRTVPIPVPRPARSGASRAELGLPAARFTFLVTLDHLSVTERKNPVAAVEAFRRAFPVAEPGGPVLVVKTLNRAHRWAEHERIRFAAAGRPDVVVVDRHLDRADQMALTAEADCLVSLHRAEGLGLHLMEAMWLGTPTIATRYSGNLAFMDDSNSTLVDATLVDVVHGERYFPAEAQWAEPDLDQAAAWMRRMVAEPALAARLAVAGRVTMERQPSLADTGREIARLSRIARDAPAAARG